MNHSIPDAVAFAIECPAGVVIHTGDFKVDYTPISDGPTDLTTIAEYGKKVFWHFWRILQTPNVRALPPQSIRLRNFCHTVPARGEKANHHCHICVQSVPDSADHRSGGSLRPQGGGVRPQYGQQYRDGPGTGLSACAGQCVD